ncbi:TPA: hypothetical protein RRJ41_001173 [Klebsiella pneumoniae]|nr:hypothetical protein [Klebsiella pneumoniae subsp. pneumoniae]HDY9290420.1 hypothetical protein [Klebsiella pneumoniae]
MQDFNFTPGPWEWWTSNSFLRLSSKATGKDGGVIDSTVMRDGHPTLIVKKEDMSLIAAAPELLEALQLLMAEQTGGKKSCGHNGFTCMCPYDKARAAIAKALGK